MKSPSVECRTSLLDTHFVEITAPNGALVTKEEISNGRAIFEVKDPAWAQTYSVKAGASETTFKLATPSKSFDVVCQLLRTLHDRPIRRGC